jgi:O-antigen/teichoic acid export membrane protein
MDKRKQWLGTLWNLAGNFVYAICIWLLTFVIGKHSPKGVYSDAAVYAVSLSFGVIFIVISNYGLRAYQVSDSYGAFTDQEYISSRHAAILLGSVCCLVFSLIMRFSFRQIVAINLFMLAQNTYAYTDVLHGIIQKEGRIDLCGKSLGIRGVLTAVAFAATLYLSNDLLLSLGAVAAAGAIAIGYDVKNARRYYTGNLFKVDFRNPRIFKLLKNGFPMLLFTILGSLTMYVPRVILERLSGDAAVGIFAYVFAPTVAITTFAVGVMLPFVPHMALMLKQKNVKALIQSLLLPFFTMFIVGICALLVSLWIGDRVLLILYNSAVSQYKMLLVLTMLVSTLWSFACCCNNFFIVVRNLRTIIWVNAAGLFFTVLLCFILIPPYGMYGAGYAMAAAITFQLLLSAVMIARSLRRISQDSKQ